MIVFLGILFLHVPLHAQWKEQPSTGSPTQNLPNRTTLAGQSGMGPFLKARLVDRENNAKNHRAVVEVQTDGVELVSGAAGSDPKLHEAHIQYQLDDGPVQNSTARTWIFENLNSGKHEIYVSLAGNDNRPVGKGATLTVTVP